MRLDGGIKTYLSLCCFIRAGQGYYPFNPTHCHSWHNMLFYGHWQYPPKHKHMALPIHAINVPKHFNRPFEQITHKGCFNSWWWPPTLIFPILTRRWCKPFTSHFQQKENNHSPDSSYPDLFVVVEKRDVR